MSELHHFTSWFNSVVFLWILYVMSWSNPVMYYIHIIIRFCHVQFCTNECPYYFWFSSCTIHVIMVFRHAHLCTNDYPCYYRFLSYTSLYQWLSMLLWVFVMHISVWMTIHILMCFCNAHLCTNEYPYSYGFSSCTSLYEWLFCSQFLSNVFI